MSGQMKPDREVIFSMEVDRYFEFADQAVIVARADSRPIVRPPANAPILTVEADELTEFTQKAIPAAEPPSGGGDVAFGNKNYLQEGGS